MKAFRYIKTITKGIYNLGQGMYITMLNFFRPKVTEQYPENRGKHQYQERFRAKLQMPHDERNHHKCTACGICMNVCPNGTIFITTKMEMDEATGKERKVLDKYVYDIGGCIFCALCTSACPHDALSWSNEFEHSVFSRDTLFLTLNKPGSSLVPKAPKAPADSAAGAAKSETSVAASANAPATVSTIESCDPASAPGNEPAPATASDNESCAPASASETEPAPATK